MCQMFASSSGLVCMYVYMDWLRQFEGLAPVRLAVDLSLEIQRACSHRCLPETQVR